MSSPARIHPEPRDRACEEATARDLLRCCIAGARKVWGFFRLSLGLASGTRFHPGSCRHSALTSAQSGFFFQNQFQFLPTTPLSAFFLPLLYSCPDNRFRVVAIWKCVTPKRLHGAGSVSAFLAHARQQRSRSLTQLRLTKARLRGFGMGRVAVFAFIRAPRSLNRAAGLSDNWPVGRQRLILPAQEGPICISTSVNAALLCLSGGANCSGSEAGPWILFSLTLKPGCWVL